MAILGVSFVPLSLDSPTLFTFGEFLTALALSVVVWTVVDRRYRFRIKVAPFPIYKFSFFTIMSVGIATLATDLWIANAWLVPVVPLSVASWQAIQAFVFLSTFGIWVWFAFVAPPVYGRRNASKYGKELYKIILNGSDEELAMVANELSRSAKFLIAHSAGDRIQAQKQSVQKKVNGIANDILLLIGNSRICRVIVDKSANTARAFFNQATLQKKRTKSLRPFARNLTAEAIKNKDSFLYIESSEYKSGLIGSVRPISQALYSDYILVEEVGSGLEVDYMEMAKWSSQEWEAYTRAVLITVETYVNNFFWKHSFVLHSALSNIEHACSYLYKLDGNPNGFSDDAIEIVSVVQSFVCNCVMLLDKAGPPKSLEKRHRDKRQRIDTFYDLLADLVLKTILNTANIRLPTDLAWIVQYIRIWDGIFLSFHLDSEAGKILKYMVRRQLYNTIIEMNKFPNFNAARALRFCINVLGFEIRTGNGKSDEYPLHRVILTWIENNFYWLYSNRKNVAEACLPGDVHFDIENHRLVKVLEPNAFHNKPEEVYFYVRTVQNQISED